jgi:integrase/recombinase XerD
MTPMAPHLTAFLRERLPLQRGDSPHTCASYAYTFQLLLTYASQRLHLQPFDLCLEHLDAPMVIAFLAYLEAERGNRPSTRNTRLAAITSFMRFVEYRVPSILEQSRRILAIPTKKTDVPLVKHLSMAEMHAILEAPDLRTRRGIRAHAMLHLCFAAGLRVSELLTVPLTAIRFHPAPTIRVLGKGRRERALPLWKQTADDLRAWLAVRGDVGIPELFLNAQGRVMAREGFAYVLHKYVRLAAHSCPSLERRGSHRMSCVTPVP